MKFGFLIFYSVWQIIEMEKDCSLENNLFIFFFLSFFCFLIFQSQSRLNIVSLGNFQDFSPILNNNGIQRDIILNSNYSSWFDYNNGAIQLKQFTTLFTTVCIDLSSSIPYILCQAIELEISRKYILQYDLYCESRLQKMNLSAKINNKPISTLYIQNSSTFSSKKDYFQATEQKNILCFSQIHEKIGAFQNISLAGIGGMIDNISLTVIPIWNLEILVRIIEQKSLITLSCSEQSKRIDLELLFSNYFLHLEQLRILTFSIKQFNSSFISLQVPYNFSFNLNKLRFSLKNITNILSIDGQQFDIKFNINFQTQAVLYLSESQRQTLVTVKKLTVDFASWIIELVNSCKLSLASYFVFTLIGFEHVTLLYIFLDIPTVPNFTKDVYYNLLQIYFGDGNMLTWSSQLFHFDKGKIHLEPEARLVSDQIEEYKDGRKWMGYFGVSNYLFNNNVDDFILLILLVIKLLFLKLVIRLLKHKIKKRIKLRFCLILVVEFCSMIPGFVLSSFPSIVYARLNNEEKIQHLCQILLIFCCLYATPLYFIVRRHKPRKQKNICSQEKDEHGPNINVTAAKSQNFTHKGLYKDKLKLKKARRLDSQFKILRQTKIRLHKVKIKTQDLYSIAILQAKKEKRNLNNIKSKRKINKFYYSQTGDILLLFSTSFLVCLDNPFHLLIGNTFAIFFKIIGYHEVYKLKGGIMKSLEFLINGTWLIHHCIFIVFYTLSLKQQYRDIEGSNQNLITFGLAAIFTIFICTILQLIRFLVELVRILLKFTKLICNCSNAHRQVYHKSGESKESDQINNGKKMKQKRQVCQIEEISYSIPLKRAAKNT